MESPVPPIPATGLSSDDKLWGAIAHFSAFAIYFTGVGHIVGPMIIWLWKKDVSPFASEEGKEAMNFQISVTIYAIACGVLCFVLIGFPLLAALHVFQIVCIIIGGLRALDGRPFRYPLNLRLVK